MTAQELAKTPVAPATPPVQPPLPAQQGNTITPLNPIEIRSDYAALGVTTGYTPKVPSQLRFFIVGPSGGGKTSFASSIPGNLILDFEDGAWGVPHTKACRIVIKDTEHLEKIVSKLVEDAEKGRRAFNRVTFDTFDQLMDMVAPALAAKYEVDDITEYGAKGAGYSKLRTAAYEYLSRLERAGYSWIVIGHVTEKTITVNKADRTVLRPVLIDSLSKQILRNCELFVMINAIEEYEPVYREVNGRRIETGTKPVLRYKMQATSGLGLTTTQTKLRGVPNMNLSLSLPDTFSSGITAWELFEKSYSESVNQIMKAE